MVPLDLQMSLAIDFGSNIIHTLRGNREAPFRKAPNTRKYWEKTPMFNNQRATIRPIKVIPCTYYYQAPPQKPALSIEYILVLR